MYGSLEEIRKRIPESELIQLTDDDSTGEVDETVILELISGVDELIDSHLRGRYSLPLDPVPPMVRAIALDLYLYEVYGHRPAFGIPETVKDKRANQMKVLVAIKNGELQLGIAGAVTPPAATSANSIKAAGPQPVFTPDTLKNF